jgi:UDP-N-acetylmuramyl pentapeptide phosphotransferase/UDP-N-acetylglucosamine-1-phosphate transferase
MLSPEGWALAGFALGIPFVLMAILVGRRFGLLDQPSPIKPHPRPVPHTGGTAIVGVIVVAGLLASVPPGVLGGLLLMWVVGFIDDVRGLPAGVKLAGELPALVVSTAALGIPIPIAIAPIALGLVLVNAFNVVDGLDGLAGGVALPSLIVLAAAPGWGGALSAIALGAVIAFLGLNLRPARVFLGDQGSLVLGQLLWLVPLAFFRLDASGPWAAWFLLWAFPFVNATFVVIARVRARRNVLRGDRSHLYDALNRRLGLARTLVICWTIAALGAVGALLAG